MAAEGTVDPARQVGTAAPPSCGLLHDLLTGQDELVRFRITLTPGTDPTGPEGVCYRFLPPTWYDKAI